MKKRLDYSEIKSVVVISRRLRVGEYLREVPLDRLQGENAPDGCFAVYEKGIFLPKRKYGQRFVVSYTQYKQEEF